MRRIALLGLLFVLSAAALSASWRRELDRYRCECGSTQWVQTHSLAGLTLHREVRFEHDDPLAARHAHLWQTASRYREFGPGGLLGKSVQTEQASPSLATTGQ